MESIGDRQKVRVLPRLSLRALVTGVLGAAAIGAALLFTAGEAHAAPVTVPGIGEIQIPNEIATQLGIPVPAQESTAGEAGDFRPVTNPEADDRIPGVGEADASRMVAIPERVAIAPADSTQDSIPVQSLSPEPLRPATPAPAPEARSVVIAGLGSFSVPAALPPLVGIPGVTDASAVPAPMPAAMPKRTTGQRALDAARSKLGAYYRAGGNGPDSFDCSGFVQWSYREAGVELPRTSYSQLAAGTPVPLDDLQPGDLVSYYGGGHSAMYLGDGKIIHASDYGSGVTISPLNNMPVTGARRF
ncbi:C40 family peptidase [Nocardia sp. CDC153]|uniref:C40 family peptidase n=1 Tax=Nocardia sp. CDC153 TaxID=3112167 RepID=UPI002DBC7AF4|nr:C40 family peptidase [Nocardia sp. CDC153]MEC3951803.1 C40 family peptidase [Nocardia sp. CDC153]